MRGSGNPDLARLVPAATGDCLSKETGNKNCHKVASQRSAAWAEQPQLSGSLSAISHIIGASVEQRSDFGHINTATSFVWQRYKRLSQINLCNNFPTQGPPMTLVPDAGMSHFCLILPDSLHCFIHVSKREIQQQALIHRIVACRIEALVQLLYFVDAGIKISEYSFIANAKSLHNIKVTANASKGRVVYYS